MYFHLYICTHLASNQSRTQSLRDFWPAGERPERLWDKDGIKLF